MKKKQLTPITDFLTEYSKSGMARFHMPGHKGNYTPRNRNVKSFASYDITEINGADSLYSASGIIKQSEAITKKIYQTYATIFSTGGSTLCIQAMLLCTLKKGDTIICGRNAHIAFHNSLALFDFNPHWVYPESVDNLGISGKIAPAQIKTAIEETIAEKKPAKAVYITSPDYMGIISDVKGIANICKQYNIPLLVDNAHGAHLKFTGKDMHPIKLGATLCCDSAHKTLPVLTGGAYLHSGNTYNELDLKAAMSLVGSTSPSYLILNSLDRCNEYMINCAENDFSTLSEYKDHIIDIANSVGFTEVPNTDCTKVTLNTYSIGLTADETAEYLRLHKIECEFAKGSHLVLLITPFNTSTEFQRLSDALLHIPTRRPIPFLPYKYPETPAEYTPHEAFCADSEILPIEQSEGRCAAEVLISCPPGVPIVSYGEKISEIAIKSIKKSGKTTIKVVK